MAALLPLDLVASARAARMPAAWPAAPPSPWVWALSSMSPWLWPSGQGRRDGFRRRHLPDRRLGHAGAVPPAAAALGAGEPGEGVDRRTRVGVGIEALPGGAADAAPLADQQGAAEQVRPDRDPVEPCLVRAGRSRVRLAWSGNSGSCNGSAIGVSGGWAGFAGKCIRCRRVASAPLAAGRKKCRFSNGAGSYVADRYDTLWAIV